MWEVGDRFGGVLNTAGVPDKVIFGSTDSAENLIRGAYCTDLVRLAFKVRRCQVWFSYSWVGLPKASTTPTVK